MINKLTMAFMGMIMSVNFAYSQRSSSSASAENTPIDYRDTWQSPYVTDEMTVDPEQNKSWRMGEYKFPAKI